MSSISCYRQSPQNSSFFVTFPWTYSNTSTSFLYWAPKTWTQYPSWGLPRAEERGTITSPSLLVF